MISDEQREVMLKALPPYSKIYAIYNIEVKTSKNFELKIKNGDTLIKSRDGREYMVVAHGSKLYRLRYKYFTSDSIKAHEKLISSNDK